MIMHRHTVYLVYVRVYWYVFLYVIYVSRNAIFLSTEGLCSHVMHSLDSDSLALHDNVLALEELSFQHPTRFFVTGIQVSYS
jgi:hypothetical protein